LRTNDCRLGKGNKRVSELSLKDCHDGQRSEIERTELVVIRGSRK
jgi:hypothetical protein